VGSGTTIVHGWLSYRGRSGLAMKIRNAISTRSSPVGVRVVTLESIRMAILTAGWLRDIRDDLHATGNGSSRSTTSGSIGRSCWSAKTFRELLDKRHSNIVSGNVDSIRNTQDYK
jgi:hypothetical protein